MISGSKTKNLFFRTSEISWALSNVVYIREGGQQDQNPDENALACSIESGYIQALPEGNATKFEEYMSLRNLNANNTCVSYISLGDSSHGLKLSKFIKILCYSNDYKYNSGNVYSILLTNAWEEIFGSDVEKLDSDIKIIGKEGASVTVEFNCKKLNIVNGTKISLSENGFNFAYLLEKTNDYCLLSGDNSYMEGLTLNKKVIHVGMGNKYNMINQLQTQISHDLGITYLTNYKEMDITHQNSRRSGVYVCNNADFLKYAYYISDSRYKTIQQKYVKKDFFKTLTDKIIGKMSGGMHEDTYKNKYLKYKQKYLSLKNSK